MQAIVEQYLNDGVTPNAACTAAAPCVSSSTAASFGTSPQPCASTNWTGMDLCKYAKTVPSDPANNTSRNCITGVTTGTLASCLMRYRLIFSGTSYEVSTMMESTVNAGKTANDGGVNDTNGTVGQHVLLQIYSDAELTTNLFRIAGTSTAL